MYIYLLSPTSRHIHQGLQQAQCKHQNCLVALELQHQICKVQSTAIKRQSLLWWSSVLKITITDEFALQLCFFYMLFWYNQRYPSWKQQILPELKCASLSSLTAILGHGLVSRYRWMDDCFVHYSQSRGGRIIENNNCICYIIQGSSIQRMKNILFQFYFARDLLR